MSSSRISPRLFKVLVAALACAMLALVFAPSIEAKKSNKAPDAIRLRRAVDADGIKEHLKVLQEIAIANEGNRASGFSGYDESLDYVEDVLDDSGYKTTRQEFDFDAFEENAPAELEQVAPNPTVYEEGTHFFTMEYSGSGEPTANVTNVDLVLPPGPNPSDSDSGCEASDFAGFPAGNIALMQRGTCDFGLKAANAAAAGAVGAIIFNEGTPGFPDRIETLSGTLGDFRPGIPTMGISFELGNQLAATSGLRMRMFTDTTITPTTTENLLAETRRGDPDNVVIAGGHLDSVPEGPGINDNGSGTMALLEIAQQMDKLNIKPKNKIRFAFWGGEEAGLRGSNFYVADLTDEEYEDIALYLNFDMIGSPNFVRFVYDGDGSAFGIEGPPGSDDIEESFTDAFAQRGLESEETAFDGRSDYFAFIGADIPAGGLFSGAEVRKTEEQEEIYGGVAGLAYDPCYHQPCDTYFNVSDTALNQFSDAMAKVIVKYGRSTASLGADESAARALGRESARSMTFQGPHAAR